MSKKQVTRVLRFRRCIAGRGETFPEAGDEPSDRKMTGGKEFKHCFLKELEMRERKRLYDLHASR